MSAAESPAPLFPPVPDHLSPRLPAPLRLWLAPIRPQLAVVAETTGKPLGQLTMPEIAAWGIVGLYAVLTGMVAGRIAANIAATALRGPGRR